MEAEKTAESRNWIDITQQFKDAAKELKLGELVSDTMFGLYDAMAAIELMDPKMDAGMMCNRKQLLSFEERVDKKLIKIDNFSIEELIEIIDSTYSCLVAWLEGYSLAQTVLINLYLHNPKLVADKTLKSFCIIILKIVENINKMVLQAQVYEEEDFQPKTFGKLAEDISNSKALALIKVAEEELNKQLKTSNDDLEKLKQLHLRINFSKHFFLVVYNFKKQVLNQQVVSNTQEFVCSLKSFLENCESFLKLWKASLGVAKNNNESSKESLDYPTTIGFEPLINQRLLPPSFPRYTHIKPINEIVGYLELFILRIKRLLQVQNIESFFEVACFFNDYSRCADTCIVSRSMLLLFYTPHNGLVLGERQMMTVIKDACKQFIPSPLLSSKTSLDATLKDQMQTFFEGCVINFKSMLQTYGYNKARQREKIAYVLKEFILTMDDSITLDRNIGHRINNPEFGYFQYWILFYKFWLMSHYLLTGFELELYSANEFSYIYMELDYICDYIVLILKRAREVSEHNFNLANLTASNANSASKNRKKQTKSNKNRDKLVLDGQLKIYYKALNLMAGALHRITLAFAIEGKIEQPKQNLNTERIRYQRRFAPLSILKVGLSYDKYHDKWTTYSKSGTATLYQEALLLLSHARTNFEQIKLLSLEGEITSYIKLCKTNSVVINLLQSGHNALAKPELIFTESLHFPIIKFVKT